ncbi:hypothetical protein [Inhella gelatinilytica]|uniref:MSHA biogenesis protein MshJ n=1 Tax=Inhella gelatinilytica TaxID=2795030 RepID=A0A931IRH8_9BURK|nr:hypothetical protein [Inhella gelatinilytica]MBH9551335.1 hypothetical protein [Inhella gelatinilytica]
MKRSSWHQQWRAWQQAFDARAPRERWLLAGTVVALALWLGDSLALNPAMKRWKAAQTQAGQLESRVAELRQVQAQARVQAEQQRQQRAAELQRLQAELGRLEGRPGALEAARMLTLLEEVVAQQGGAVRLRALSAKPDTRVAPAAAASEPVGPRLFRHGMEIVVTGRYEALHRYLADLAHSESRLRVRQLALTVREHPEIEMTVLVETLSPQAAWLTL